MKLLAWTFLFCTQLHDTIAAQCANDQPTITAPRENVWKGLTEEEHVGVNSLLSKTLGLTGSHGNDADSFVWSITLRNPNKTAVLNFIDGKAKTVSKYARATVVFGATNVTDLYWQEYMVGPLPVTDVTIVEPLTYPFNNKQPGRINTHPIYTSTEAGTLFQLKISKEIEDITKELWNATLTDGTIGVRIGTPFWEQDGRTISWAPFLSNPTGLSSPTLVPLGVSVQFDITSRNWEEWQLTGWYSRGVFYESTEEFRAAVFSPSFVKPPPNVNGDWASTDRRGGPLPLDDLPPPVTVSQGNQRFRLDEEESYVSWMDFGFFFSVSYDTGLALYDINFQGKRVMYELSLQEALTAYAGSDPFGSQVTFFDTEAQMGSAITPLIRGYDCPMYATYLNTTISSGNSTKVQPDAICIFEYDTGYPIRRHSFSPFAPHTSVAKNIVLTVRTIATVGNYDFLIEYLFSYDGSIEVSSRFSGYISAIYWDGNPDYGLRIHDYLSGSLHDHVLNFKADLDILGTKNSVQKLDIVPESTTYPWSRGNVHNTFKAVRGWVPDESEASINWSPNDATLYAVVNKDAPNTYGEYPGFRIKRGAGVSHLTVQNSTSIRNAGNYATHDFYVTKQRDTEPRAADVYNEYAPADPLVDFSKFLDGDSLDQEDLVLWFNLGMHHLPHTGDLPNTMFSAAHSSMRFEPFNYIAGDPSVAINQQVRLDYDEAGDLLSREEFGKKESICK